MFNLHHKVSERRIKEQDVIFFTRVDDEMVLFIFVRVHRSKLKNFLGNICIAR